MILNVNIIGQGLVNGGGTYESGATATLTATPSSGYTFKHFVYTTSVYDGGVASTTDYQTILDGGSATLYSTTRVIDGGNALTRNVYNIKSNPYSFVVGDDNITMDAVFYVSFESYMSGIVGFSISDSALNSIKIKRDIATNADSSELTTRILELAEADLLKWYCSTPSSFSGAKDSDGGWSHQESSYSLSDSDRRMFMRRANELYKKWGEYNGFGGSVRIINL